MMFKASMLFWPIIPKNYKDFSAKICDLYHMLAFDWLGDHPSHLKHHFMHITMEDPDKKLKTDSKGSLDNDLIKGYT